MWKHFEQSNRVHHLLIMLEVEWHYIGRPTNAERLDLDLKSYKLFQTLATRAVFVLKFSFLLGLKDHQSSFVSVKHFPSLPIMTSTFFKCCLTLLQELEALKSQVQSQSAEINQMKTERQELLRRAEAGVNQTNVTFCAIYIIVLLTPAELINCSLLSLSLQM